MHNILYYSIIYYYIFNVGYQSFTIFFIILLIVTAPKFSLFS